jgi:DMSO/TMAO reductase YedYZ molybdopterin-dependent catalytic subunit
MTRQKFSNQQIVWCQLTRDLRSPRSRTTTTELILTLLLYRGSKLTLEGLASGVSLSLDIRKLVNRFLMHDQITRLVCVEGCSAIARVGLRPTLSLLTLETARHPQTLLVTHLGGQPLTVEQGAPLRLLVPVKLGLKNVKAITRITYSAEEPTDYWAPYGYSSYDGIQVNSVEKRATPKPRLPGSLFFQEFGSSPYPL